MNHWMASQTKSPRNRTPPMKRRPFKGLRAGMSGRDGFVFTMRTGDHTPVWTAGLAVVSTSMASQSLLKRLFSGILIAFK